jgi:hypothetical protein
MTPNTMGLFATLIVNDAQYEDTQHNGHICDTQHKRHSIMPPSIMDLSVRHSIKSTA